MTADLILRAQSGDPDAFAELYATHREFLLNVARKRVPGEAEDIVQEAFVRALRYLHQWRDQGRGERAWLTTITVNVCADWGRRTACRPVDLIDPTGHDERVDPAPLPDEVAATGEVRDRLVDAVRALSTDQLDAVALHYLGDVSVRDAADRLGISRQALLSRLARARKTLAGLLADRGLAHA